MNILPFLAVPLSCLKAIMALILLSSCADNSSDTHQSGDDNIEARDSGDHYILSDETLASEVVKGLAGNSDSQLRVAEHIIASNGDYTAESLGWLIASSESGNPVAVQSLISFLTSEKHCKAAEDWFSKINKEAEDPSFIEKYFHNTKVQSEYFRVMKEQIENCLESPK